MKKWWNPILTPLSLPRWPCCDGAKCSEEYRKFRSTAGLLSTLPCHDPCFISFDATLRLTAITETMLTQCWSLGPWTLKKRFCFFLYRLFYTSMDSAVSVCLCVLFCVNVERWSFQRRGLEDLFFFVLLYNEDGNSHFWTLTVHTFFSCNEQNRELNDQKYFDGLLSN